LHRFERFRLFNKALIGGILPPIVALTVAAAAGAGLSGCERRETGRQAEVSPPVVRVNGNSLLKNEFESYLPDDYQTTLTASEKQEYLNRWITTQVLYEAAMQSGVGVTPGIEARLERFKKDLVADRLVQKVIAERAIVTEEEVREFYAEHEDEYTRELRVSHILVNSMEDAEEVKEELKKRTFSWVARRRSIDKHTGVGGDLGFLSKGNMIPDFEKVVFDMKIGEVSDVIESELGYHFVKVTDAREARNKLEYVDVAEDITRILLLEKRVAVYDSLITTLTKNATIEILDPELRMALEALPKTSPPVGNGEQ
jgi:peptidyl-prolyl cis-trans isomerase C